MLTVGTSSGMPRLGKDGIAVRDGFLSERRVRELKECLDERRARGDFRPARIGGPGDAQRRAHIRGDSICWIVPPVLPPEQQLLDDFEQLRLALNRDEYLGLFDIEVHYACYPPGAGYASHLDQPLGRGHRRVSLALYLNQGWTTAAGGELRLFDDAGGHRDIAPVGGRLVCFRSEGRWHEVLRTRKERCSVSGWFRTRD